MHTTDNIESIITHYIGYTNYVGNGDHEKEVYQSVGYLALRSK